MGIGRMVKILRSKVDKERRVKIIAFHLPQFHEIPENDQWWGEGFTEWTNVKRGRKLFPTHYQPKVPLHNNYYDLSNPDVLIEQARMAKKNGIYGFCFYHYYFTGKKLLEKPVVQYLNQKEKIPYCFSWANQSFTRTWYGKNGNNELLLRQTYGNEEEWTEHFNYLLPFFQDEKYIKVNNAPMFLIYLPQEFAKCSQMISLWNQLARNHGFSGIHFVAMDTWNGTRWFPFGFDATVDFEPLCSMREIPEWAYVLRNKRRQTFQEKGISSNILKNALMVDNICTYEMICKISENRTNFKPAKVNYLGAFTGWDNTARKDESGCVVRGSTPLKFENYLRKQVNKSLKNGSEYLFINAWNEWSEGAYLEPDEKYGYAYLKAVRKVMKEMINEE